jgi:hypothetical protein
MAAIPARKLMMKLEQAGALKPKRINTSVNMNGTGIFIPKIISLDIHVNTSIQ